MNSPSPLRASTRGAPNPARAARRPQATAWRVPATALALLLALLASWTPAPAHPARGTAAPPRQDLGDRALFEAVAPEAQWSPRGAAEWQTVAVGEIVNAGDRVRTGPGARARLIY